MGKKSGIYFLCLCLIGLSILTGCGQEEKLSAESVKENTVLIRTDGTMDQYITGTFDKEYYSEKDLKDFAEGKIKDYNKREGGKRISLVSVHVEKQIASMLIEYQSVEDYIIFNSQKGSFMTVGEAKLKDSLPDKLFEIENNTEVSLEDTKLDEKWYVFSLSADTNIKVSGTIKYYNNAILLNPSVVKAETEKEALIIFK